ncbi:MAG TPA: hypothetical protein VM469_01235 [Pseudoxanthomonas sp.]|nr:hypothetical protein [Pseudoxanthomonas sp.]
MTFDHFSWVSRALGVLVVGAGASMAYTSFNGDYGWSAAVILLAAMGLGGGLFLKARWAHTALLAVTLVANILAVFYFFPPFVEQDYVEGSPVLRFLAFTAAVAAFGVYLYYNQAKMRR